ncbi:hypothetical protein [Marinobacter sp. SS21]|uniref:hypothetical protein n=1 Tax=Marinobacter sp. SS21 TaxID=2979460 RepID=UPI00232E0CFE|nr:hypothetical protein [Marinobacter sp. SS21]MDC0661258.1 hypothetical protein [Marinobacter sp. SS21]
MKRSLALLAVMLPVLAAADGYPSGLSDTPAQPPASSEAQRLLDRQRQSGAPQQGELSTQLYVDSQKRIAETFRRPVPESLSELSKSGD